MSLPPPPAIRDGPTLKVISRPASARAAGKNELAVAQINDRSFPVGGTFSKDTFLTTEWYYIEC